jgi:hypothetical protein
MRFEHRTALLRARCEGGRLVEGCRGLGSPWLDVRSLGVRGVYPPAGVWGRSPHYDAGEADLDGMLPPVRRWVFQASRAKRGWWWAGGWSVVHSWVALLQEIYRILTTGIRIGATVYA